MGLRDIYKQNIKNKQMFQEQMRGRTPITAPQTPIAQPSPDEGVNLSEDTTPIAVESQDASGVGAGAEVGVDIEGGGIDPGEGYESGASDYMGTGAKMAGTAIGGITGPLGLLAGAAKAGKNVMAGKPSLGDLSTAVSLTGAASQVGAASSAGATPGQIFQGMARVNPMQIAGSMLTTGLLSELGFDRSSAGRFGRTVGGMLGSAFGPMGSVTGQMVGGALGTAVGDVTGTRPDDEKLDYYEQQRGAGGWRGWLNPKGYVQAQRDRQQYLQQTTDTGGVGGSLRRMQQRYLQQLSDSDEGESLADYGLEEAEGGYLQTEIDALSEGQTGGYSYQDDEGNVVEVEEGGSGPLETGEGFDLGWGGEENAGIDLGPDKYSGY